MTLLKEDVNNIMIGVTQGIGNHGDFLVLFAKAFCHADEMNKQLLMPVATRLIEKYQLSVCHRRTQ